MFSTGENGGSQTTDGIAVGEEQEVSSDTHSTDMYSVFIYRMRIIFVFPRLCFNVQIDGKN